MCGPGPLLGPMLAVLGRSWAYVGGLVPSVRDLEAYVGGSGPLLGPMLAVLGGPGPKSGPNPSGNRVGPD